VLGDLVELLFEAAVLRATAERALSFCEALYTGTLNSQLRTGADKGNPTV
jgi:hypothetical protein